MFIGDNGQLFGWSESTWTSIDQIGILLGVAMPILTAALALLAWIKRESLRSWLRNNRFPSVGGLVRKDAQWSAIVFTVSKAEVPLWVMKRARPAWVGLVGSKAVPAPVEALLAAARDNGIRIVGAELIDDPDNPMQTLAAARGLLATLRANGVTNVAVDVTGGKVPMSLGAFMAAEEARADSIYVSVEYEHGQPKPSTAHIRCVSRPNPVRKE